MSADNRKQRCAGTTRAGQSCKWSTWATSEFCLHHAAGGGDATAIAELAARGKRGATTKAEQAASRRRERVPLDSARAIREYIEKLAALAEGSKGEVTARVSAGVKAAMAAAQLLRDELEKRAAEIAELLEKYPALARRIEEDKPQ